MHRIKPRVQSEDCFSRALAFCCPPQPQVDFSFDGAIHTSETCLWIMECLYPRWPLASACVSVDVCALFNILLKRIKQCFLPAWPQEKIMWKALPILKKSLLSVLKENNYQDIGRISHRGCWITGSIGSRDFNADDKNKLAAQRNWIKAINYT